MRTTLFITITIILLLVFPLRALAESENDYYSAVKKTALGITPSISEMVLEKNTANKKTITVNNLTNFTLPIKVYLEGLSPKEISDIPSNMIDRFDSSKWFTIADDDKDFILQPKESRNITVEINQPPNTNPGGYYATVVFQPLIPEQFLSLDSVYIYTRVASVFLLQVKGDLNETVKFEDLKLPSIVDSSSLDYSLIIQNIGNTHSRPLVKISFKEMIGGKDYPDENVKSDLILPGLTHEYKGTYSNLPSVGIMRLKTNLTYGANNKTLDVPDKYVVIFPYRLVIGILFLVLILLLLRSKIRRRILKALKILIIGEKYQLIADNNEIKMKGKSGFIDKFFRKRR